MPESPQTPTDTAATPKRKSKASASSPSTTPTPPPTPEPSPMRDFGDDDTPEQVQDSPEGVAASEPVAPDGGTPTPEPVVQTHLSPFLVNLAKHFGLGDVDLKDMSQREVERFIEHAQRRDAFWSENLLKSQAQGATPTAGIPTPGPASPQPPAPPIEPEIDLGLDDSYPDEIKKAIKKAATVKSDKIAQLEKELQELKGQTIETKRQALFQAFDEAFDELGPAYESFFGKGTVKGVTQEQALKRQYVVMAITESDTPAQAKEKIKGIAKLLYGNGVPQSPPPPPPNPALEKAKQDYADGKVQKPEQREPANLPFGTERAVRATEEFMRKRGMIPTYSGANGTKDDLEL